MASRPERVKAWAAYSVNAWVLPVAGRVLPPGIVACGQYDDSRYWECLKFVQRALRQPVVVDYLKETEVEPKEDWQYVLSGELPTRRLVDAWRELNDS